MADEKNINDSRYAWTIFYQELADKLLLYKDKRQDLMKIMEHVYKEAGLEYKFVRNGHPFTQIDPFTFFASFNNNLSNQNRIKLLEQYKILMSINAGCPESFDGIPVLDSRNLRFTDDTPGEQMETYWGLFESAIRLADGDESIRPRFLELYDKAINFKGTSWNLTMALYWIRPYFFVNLDARNRWFLSRKDDTTESIIEAVSKWKTVLSAQEYLQFCLQCKEAAESGDYSYSTFPEMSYIAWKLSLEKDAKNEEWFPSLEEYHPGFSVEDWVELLQDKTVFNDNSLEIMMRMKDFGGAATCAQLEQKYGASINYYNSGSSSLARRIVEKTGCPVPRRNNENSRWWPVLFVGRKARANELGRYVWRLRDELSLALEKIDLSDVKLYDDFTRRKEIVDINEDEKSYWLFRIHDNTDWDAFLKHGIISYDIAGMDDYRKTVKKRPTIAKKISKNTIERKETVSEKMSTNAFDFCSLMEEEDVVYAVDMEGIVIGRCIIRSAYMFQKDEPYRHIRKVEWTHTKAVDTILLNMVFDIDDISGTFSAYRLENRFMGIENNENGVEQESDREDFLKPYSSNDFLREVFMESMQYERLFSILKRKKNIILQGPPGVGKTFAASRLAYSMLGKIDRQRIQFIQFHQNYSYEDFVMGYKPVKDGFELQYGIFYNFCKRAEKSGADHFLIIDEINRGNLSKIFGELLMLIEDEHRGEAITLAYDGKEFSVPKNLYIIGMMNTADRSLAMIDYALRRRFSFFNIAPAFESKGFVDKVKTYNGTEINALLTVIKDLNNDIKESLGEGFCIGHSYLCFEKTCSDKDLLSVVECEIIPLLEEYWFDKKDHAEHWSKRLRSVFNDKG